MVVAGGVAVLKSAAQILLQQAGESHSVSSLGWWAGYHHKLDIHGGIQTIETKLENGETSFELKLLPLRLESAS